MNSVIRLFVAVVVVLGVGVTVFAASSLEKSKWRVELKVEGEGAPRYIDRLTFEDKNFTSVIFERKKFLTSSYTSNSKEDNGLTWEAKQKSETDGELVWKGELQGDTMTGKLDWKQPDGKTVQFAMYGIPVVEEAETAAAEKSVAPGSASVPAFKEKAWWGCSLVSAFAGR